MEELWFQTIIQAPYFKEIPPEIDGKWVSASKEAAPKAYKNLKKVIRGRKDFAEKIAKPIEKTIASFIRPDFITRHCTTYGNIKDKAHDSMKRAGKKYAKRIKEGFNPAYYEAKVEEGRKAYARQWCEYIGPLKGYKAGGILGLATMAGMALTGDKKLVDYLSARNTKFEGTLSAVTTSEKLGTFKNILIRRMVRWGSWIIESGYDEQFIRESNEKLNNLVNEYRSPDIAEFEPNSVSHINFIVVEISNPKKPDEKIKQLGLDVQVSQV
jgi:hypothetical protein